MGAPVSPICFNGAMSYDFILFSPDRDANNQVVIGNRFFPLNEQLMRRYSCTSTTSSPELEAIVDKITHDVEKLPGFEEASVEGDRIIRVNTTLQAKERALEYLMDIALANGLGLAEVSDDFVVFYGDENPNFEIQIARRGKYPAVSAAALETTCTYIVDTETTNFFLVVNDKNDELRFAQAANMLLRPPHEDEWRIEYRDGENADLVGTFVTGGAQVAKFISQWMAGDKKYLDLDWEKVVLGDA